MADHPSGALRPKASIICRWLAGRAVLIDLDTNQIFELNQTGYRIWELLGEGLTADQLTDRLQQEFDAERPRLASEIRELLDRLTAERLVVETR